MRIDIAGTMLGLGTLQLRRPLMRKLCIRKNPMARSSRNSRWSLRWPPQWGSPLRRSEPSRRCGLNVRLSPSRRGDAANHRALQRHPPARRVVAPSVATVNPAPPLYDVVVPAPAPVVTDPYDDQLIYDTVVQTRAPAVATPLATQTIAPVAPATIGTAVPLYPDVYQPDRILVIDPSTGIAVQATRADAIERSSKR